MHIHEFGEKTKPVILLLPGTACYWKGNFGGVIDELSQDFLVAVVSYTGFENRDVENYQSTLDEVQRIEDYVNKYYQGQVHAIYGCSLGGSLTAHLITRNRIQMKFAMIGSSDFDQAGQLKADLMTKLFVKLIYPFIHNGCYSSSFLQKRYEKKMQSEDPYNKAFVRMVGRDAYDMSFITKQSLRNQYHSDLVTKLPEKITNPNTKIHIFHAAKMGKKYLERYQKYAPDAVIHTHDLRHEELLAVYPHEWCRLVKEICME